MIPIIKHIEKVHNTIIFIDEPESGISLSNQKSLLKSFEKAVSNECQLIITTHSYIFIKNVKKVFDLDSKNWIMSEEYLKQF
jgi:predicted ATPase